MLEIKKINKHNISLGNNIVSWNANDVCHVIENAFSVTAAINIIFQT